MTKKQITRHNQNDIIVTFWDMVNFMYSERRVTLDLHFDIVHKTTLLLEDNTKLDFLPKGKKILRLNFNSTYYRYAENMVLRGERPMDQHTLRHYLIYSTYYLGVEQACKFSRNVYDANLRQRFERTITVNALCFDYDVMVQEYDICLDYEFTDDP